MIIELDIPHLDNEKSDYFLWSICLYSKHVSSLTKVLLLFTDLADAVQNISILFKMFL